MGTMHIGVVDSDGRALTVSLGDGALVIASDAPVLSFRFSQLAAIGVDNGALEVAAIVDGSPVRLELPLADPAEAAYVADRLLDAIRA